MGGISTDSGEDKLNVELNLVPFIDLLSSLVLFLLVTAVWQQVGTIPASIESKGISQNTQADQNRLVIHLTNQGFQLQWPAGLNQGKTRMPTGIGKKNDLYDVAALADLLGPIAKMKEPPSVGVSSEDIVNYGYVIQAIDVVKKAGFISVALSTE